MTTIQVTINLPEEIYQRAERFARLINRDLSSMLADTVVSSLPPLSDQIDALPQGHFILDSDNEFSGFQLS